MAALSETGMRTMLVTVSDANLFQWLHLRILFDSSCQRSNISFPIAIGTHVAGIVAARDNLVGMVGVAPEAELFIVRVFTGEDSVFSA